MNSPFPLVVLFQGDPGTAGRIQGSFGGQGAGQVRFGRRVPRLNPLPDGKSYTIQVQDTGTFELVKNVLREHGAGSSAWVSVNGSAGPQWVEMSRYV